MNKRHTHKNTRRDKWQNKKGKFPMRSTHSTPGSEVEARSCLIPWWTEWGNVTHTQTQGCLPCAPRRKHRPAWCLPVLSRLLTICRALLLSTNEWCGIGRAREQSGPCPEGRGISEKVKAVRSKLTWVTCRQPRAMVISRPGLLLEPMS